MTVQTYSLIPTTTEQVSRIAEFEAERFARDQRSKSRGPGGRLSITCPVQRVKAVYDSWFEQSIDEGVGWRGHMMESYALAVLLDGLAYQAQVPIEWSHGLSAWDAVVDAPDSPFDGIIDWKSKDGEGTPTAANRAQAEIMLVGDGHRPGAVVSHWQLNVSNWTATGPYQHVLTSDAYEARVRELEATARIIDYFADLQAQDEEPERSEEWSNPQWWHTMGLDDKCGGCFEYTKYDANNALERLWFRFEMAHDGERESKRDRERLRGQLVAAATLLAKREVARDEKAVIEVWGGDGGKITRSPGGSWRINRNKTATARESSEPVIAG